MSSLSRRQVRVDPSSIIATAAQSCSWPRREYQSFYLIWHRSRPVPNRITAGGGRHKSNPDLKLLPWKALSRHTGTGAKLAVTPSANTTSGAAASICRRAFSPFIPFVRVAFRNPVRIWINLLPLFEPYTEPYVVIVSYYRRFCAVNGKVEEQCLGCYPIFQG